MKTIKIYVNLLNEGSPAVRPTQAEVVREGVYKILPTHNYKRAEEVGQFPPVSLVRYVEEIYDGQSYLFAATKAV